MPGTKFQSCTSNMSLVTHPQSSNISLYALCSWDRHAIRTVYVVQTSDANPVTYSYINQTTQ